MIKWSMIKVDLVKLENMLMEHMDNKMEETIEGSVRTSNLLNLEEKLMENMKGFEEK